MTFETMQYKKGDYFLAREDSFFMRKGDVLLLDSKDDTCDWGAFQNLTTSQGQRRIGVKFGRLDKITKYGASKIIQRVCKKQTQ
jgi:hypothetical protein